MAGRIRRPRFGVRAMLLGVAIAAVLWAVALNWLPAALRKRRAEALLAEQYRSLVDPGAAPIQSFDRLGERRPGDLVAAEGLAAGTSPGDSCGWSRRLATPAADCPWSGDRRRICRAFGRRTGSANGSSRPMTSRWAAR